jgi:small subunit ribosomal protein S21
MSEKQNEVKGIFVERRDGEDIETLLRRFKKKVSKSGILQDLKKKSFYVKPSEHKKKKSLDARRRNEKERMKNIKVSDKFKKRSKQDEESRSDR